MKAWKKNIVEWTEKDTAYLSIVFTWQLPKAFSRCAWYKQQGLKVVVGGVAVKLMPDYLRDVAEIRDDIPTLERHNPDATRTSEGCPNKCSFCGVKIIHPIFKELPSWKVAPIICDDNLTACSRSHFNKVIDIMKPVKNVDINQGLDARLLQKWQLDRLQELHLYKLRFAWDNISQESKILGTLEAVINAGFPKSKIHVYVLFNHNDTPEDTLYRCETLWGMGVVPNVQRFQPLDCLMKNQHIDPNWNDQLLRDFTLYWSRRHLPLETHRILRLRKVMDYIRGRREKCQFSLSS